jgi:hypothetical protein
MGHLKIYPPEPCKSFVHTLLRGAQEYVYGVELYVHMLAYVPGMV